MAGYNKQYFGIKFPFTANNLDGFFVDLNSDIDEKVISEIAHVILTPKKSRIRKPDFGTDLVKFLFNDSIDTTWENVKEEVKESIKKYISNAELDSIEVITPDEEPNSIYLDMRLTFRKGQTEEHKRIAIKL